MLSAGNIAYQSTTITVEHVLPQNPSLGSQWLTDFPDGLSAYSLSPDGSRCLLMHARGGNENTQISIIDPMAPGIAPLTPVVANPRVQSRVNAWIRDGSGFFYSANDERCK